MLEYIDTETKDAPLWWHKQGRTQTASGYGLRLTTSKKALYNGRWYRVYAACVSNAASYWIETRGRRLYLRG